MRYCLSSFFGDATVTYEDVGDRTSMHSTLEEALPSRGSSASPSNSAHSFPRDSTLSVMPVSRFSCILFDKV